MAKDIRGLTTLSTGGSTFNRDSDQAPFILAEDIRGGGIGNYTTAERSAIDPRVIDNNMIIYNTTLSEYEVYRGGTRDGSGNLTGGMWHILQFAGGAIDSDDTDSRSNHTRAIITGRGLGFNRTDSELEITANNVRVFSSNSDRNAATDFWSRGDVALVEGNEYFTFAGTNDTGYVSNPPGSSSTNILLFGMSQEIYNAVVNAGVIASTTAGANRYVLSNISALNAGTINAQFNAGQATATIDRAADISAPGLDLHYLTEHGGLNGGTYFFEPGVDQVGPTTNDQWQSIIFDQSGRNAILAEFRQADSELNSRIDSERDALQDQINTHNSDIATLQTSLQAERQSRIDTDGVLRMEFAAADTAEQTAREAADTALGARIDSDNTSLDNAVATLNARIDSDIRSLHGRVTGVTEVGYGLLYNPTDSDIYVDSERLDSDFRLASLNLQGYVDVPVVTDLDTERIVISGNLNTAAPQNALGSQTEGRGRFPGLTVSGSYPTNPESLVNINGTYIRDPKSRKVLRITDDRGAQPLFSFGQGNPNPGTGATVVSSDSEEFFSYWQPGGGGFEEGLSIVATNDLGQISNNDSDSRDSDLPLNWRIVRGRWFDDTQFVVGQNFGGNPVGSSATDFPICTFNLFGDSDAKRTTPIGNLVDSDTSFHYDYPINQASVSTQNIVGGGVAAYAARNTSQEFFRTIFDENHAATREYVDGRLTEQGIQNLIGNTETLVTYSQPLTSFPTPLFPADSVEFPNAGHELTANRFLLKSTPYDRRDGRRIGRADNERYLGADIGPGENLSDARELWVRGSTDIFRNILGKIAEDSVILFSDSDGSRKFYWTVQSAVQQSFNENLYVITPKSVKYATGTLDTDSTYQVYLKPNADDLVPGDRIVPESIQPLALHLDSGQSLQDGYGVTVRRSGDTFLFGIEQNTGGGSSGGGTDTAGVNAIVNTLELERVDSDSDYLRLYGRTAEATPAVTGTRGQVSVQFSSGLGNPSTDTDRFTLVTPQGDSESYTVGARSEASVGGRRANALLAYLNDNAVGNSLVFGDASLAGETVTWTWQQTGMVDSDFLRSSNVESARFTNRIITDGTNDIPATFQRGLISQAVLPDVHINVREGTTTSAGITGPLDGSAAVVITHGDDSDHFQLRPNPTKGVRWDLNDQDVTLTVDYQLAADRAINRFDSTMGGLVPTPGSNRDSEEYFLSGAGTWVGVTHHQNSVFNDSESGLVPAPGRGAVTGVQFLADDGLWKNPHEFIDSDDIARALDFDVEYNAPTRTLEFDANYQIPAVPGTNGQRAWMILRFTNDPTTNASGTRPLESSATLLLRAPDGNGNYSDFNVHWSNADIIPGHGDEGQNDVAQIFAQAIADNYQAQGTVTDIGQAGDNGFSFLMAHEGTVDTDSTSANRFIVEFDSHFYNAEASYAIPGVDRGYPAGARAMGALHTNGTPAKDSERVFDTVVLPLFTADNAGLAPASGVADSELYLAGDGTWEVVPRSRIVFNDHEVDAYSDLFRIDYFPDSEELIFSARANIVDTDTRIESAGVVTFVPPSGDMFITDTHLVAGPTYRIAIPQATPLEDYVGRFTDFALSADGRHTVIDSDALMDSDGTGARPPVGSFFATGSTLTYRIQNVTRLESRIPIISEDFDSEKRGLVPAPGDSDTIQHYLAGDGSWQDGYANFAGDHDLEEIEHRLSVLNTEIADGLGSIEFDSDSLLFAPIDFTDLDINAGNMVITLPAEADTDMLDSEIAGVPTRDFNGTLTTNFTHYLNGVRTQIRVDLSGVSAVSRSGLVVTLTKRSNGAVRVYDEYYNPISIDINATDFGSGYFEQFELQSDYPFPPVILSTADFQRARTPATQHHAYRLITPNSVPVIDANGRADFRALSELGTLTVDGEAVGSNPPPVNSGSRKDAVSYLRLVNGQLNRQDNGGREIVSYTPYMIPVAWQRDGSTNGRTWALNELAYDPTSGDVYRYIDTRNAGFLPGNLNPMLDSEGSWRSIGRVSVLTPTELIGASQNPEVLTETGPATITGTDTGTYIQFSTTNAHTLTAYTIFYIRNASNVLQRAEVYPGSLTTPPASGRVALRTYSTTPLGNTGWTDSI